MTLVTADGFVENLKIAPSDMRTVSPLFFIDEKWFSDYDHEKPRGRRMSAMRIRRSSYLRVLSSLIAVAFPAVLFAADSNAGAMLYSHGLVMLNGSNVPRTSALFSGDVVQTGVDSVANINTKGSTVLIKNDSLVQYEGSTVKLEHGGVSISTSSTMTMRVGDVSISPSGGALTEFEAKDVDGTVQIAARKGDLTITDDTGTTKLTQGQETTRDESTQPPEKNKRKKKAGGYIPSAAQGGVMSSPWAIGIATGAAGGLTTWVLIQGDDPASPTN